MLFQDRELCAAAGVPNVPRTPSWVVLNQGQVVAPMFLGWVWGQRVTGGRYLSGGSGCHSGNDLSSMPGPAQGQLGFPPQSH